MATARNVGTPGWNFFIIFAQRVEVHNNMFLVYTKFNALSYGYKLSSFFGALSLYMVWYAFWTQLDPPLLKYSHAYFHLISNVHERIHISYVCVCLSVCLDGWMDGWVDGRAEEEAEYKS